MRNLTLSHVAAPMPLDQSLEGAQESDLESLWSRPEGRRVHGGCMAGAQRARSGRIDRPISAFSMWIVTA
jgi:hypothetical protein